jgi:hypothetical protein
MQSDAITVPQSLTAILAERKNRSRLGLSRYVVRAAEQAEQHPDKLGIAHKVKDVAGIHSTLWPNETGNAPILSVAILTDQSAPERIIADSKQSN